MEIAFLVLSLALPLALCFFAWKLLLPDAQNLPPGSLGLPIIGESLQFLFGSPEKFVSRRMEKYSPEIFKTMILGAKTAVICGPNGHKFLFSNEEKLFTVFRPHSMQKLFRSYQSAAASASQISRQTDPKIVRSSGFLKPEALVRYCREMGTITQQHLEKFWEGKQQVKAFPLAKSLTLTLACRFFLGLDDPDKIARLVDKFEDLTLGTHSLPLNFPGTAFYSANKAAAAIRNELRMVINDKKAFFASSGAVMENSILSHMIAATDSSGKHMPEAEIADKIMGFLAAGYSTVATAITFFMKYVGEKPDTYAKIQAEQMEISACKKDGESLEWGDIQKMKYSWNAVNEAMRLTPPLQGAFRETLTDVTYAGYTIPKGWKVYWTVSTTNKNPKYFPNPEEFDPSRYEDGTQVFPPFTLVPFGGGLRMCAGKEYARLAILTFVHNVVKRFEWKVVFPQEKIVGDMMPTPQKGLPIRLRSHH